MGLFSYALEEGHAIPPFRSQFHAALAVVDEDGLAIDDFSGVRWEEAERGPGVRFAQVHARTARRARHDEGLKASTCALEPTLGPKWLHTHAATRCKATRTYVDPHATHKCTN